MINPARTCNPMPQQDPKIRCGNFEEVALGYTETDAVREAMRCLRCRKQPCTAGCPVGMHIPAFIARVAEGDFAGAYDEISTISCLPAVCGRVCPQENQCEKECAQGVRGESVGIGRLERFVADWHAARSAKESPQSEANGKRVAVIGSGPAGIACAGDLAALGYAVTIFESLPMAGGILSYGIPEFVLPNEIVDREVSTLAQRGVIIQTNVVIGRDKTIDQLLEEGYGAVFIGNGAEVPVPMKLPGENLTGVWTANAYLTHINLERDKLPASIREAKRVLVVGGGNVAVDAARCARRLGAQVTIVYRRTLAESPARREELLHTREEGVAIRILTNPVEFLGDKTGKLVGVRCVEMELGEPDNSGRRRPIAKKNSEFVIEADNAVIAAGTTYSNAVTGTTQGIQLDRWGGIHIDPGGATSRPGVFAGGDAVTGPATVVLAVGAGKRAAASIHRYLSGK